MHLRAAVKRLRPRLVAAWERTCCHRPYVAAAAVGVTLLLLLLLARPRIVSPTLRRWRPQLRCGNSWAGARNSSAGAQLGCIG